MVESMHTIGEFAFMIHPLDMSDVTRKFKMLSKLPEPVVAAALRLVPPMKVSRITGVESKTGAKAEGWFVGCPLMSRQMVSLKPEYVLKKIIRTARKAEDLGAKIIGLGAFTSVVGDAGVTVDRNVSIAVTTGNSYTAGAGIQGLEKAAEKMGKDIRQCRAAVVGATGSIGKASCRLLADRVGSLVLVGRDKDRLRAVQRLLLEENEVHAEISTDVAEALRGADLVVTASGAVDAIIEPPHLKSGSVILDIARPRDVSRLVADVRDDVLVIEGGVIRVPGENVSFNFNFGFPPGLAFACMAETMILALEGTYESYSLGRDYSVERIKRICELADKHGFRLAGLRSFERTVSDEHIEAVRERALRRGAEAL